MLRKMMYCCMAAALLCLQPAVSEASISRIQHAYFEGLESLEGFTSFEAEYFNESYGNAREVLDQIIYTYPEECYLYYIRGCLSLELEDYTAVRDDVGNYLSLNPYDAEAYKLDMLACCAQEDYIAALENCRAALALAENDTVLQDFYARLLPAEAQKSEQEKQAHLSGMEIMGQAQAVLELVNKEREQEGLPPLSLHEGLSAAAMVRAGEIAEVFSHTRPDGSGFFTAIDEYHIPYSAAGENIAAGMTEPEEVMMGWMESPGHRSNIMKPEYQYIGVGYAYENGGYWVQLFMQ